MGRGISLIRSRPANRHSYVDCNRKSGPFALKRDESVGGSNISLLDNGRVCFAWLGVKGKETLRMPNRRLIGIDFVYKLISSVSKAWQ